LGRKANAGVLLLHHTGKFIEGSPQAEDAYKGRGASAFGASARVVFNLKKIKNSTKVILSNSKFKGEKFEPVAMELDVNTRWFQVAGNHTEEKKTKTDEKYEQVVGFIRDSVIKTGKGVKRGEIVKALTEKVGVTTVDRKLASALKKGDIINAGYGLYSVPLNQETELSLAE
jgi:hypothetical protein